VKSYRFLVRKGNLEAAWDVFWLLKNGEISLGLDDNAFEDERALEANGFDGPVRWPREHPEVSSCTKGISYEGNKLFL